MASDPILIQVNTELIAWYGAVVATAGLGISLYIAWRDRARVKINYRPHMFIYGGDALNYSEGVEYVSIDVINTGRRPIRIESASLVIAGEEKKYLLTDSFATHRPRVITEESPVTTFLVKQDLVDLSKIYCVVVVDGTGRQYKKYTSLFPSWVRLKAFRKRKKV